MKTTLFNPDQIKIGPAGTLSIYEKDNSKQTMEQCSRIDIHVNLNQPVEEKMDSIEALGEQIVDAVREKREETTHANMETV